MRSIILSCIAAALIITIACNQSTNNTEEGKQLAQTYCTSCHKLPEPELLDKSSWEKYMLPRMGMFLGIIEHDSLKSMYGTNDAEKAAIAQSGIFPKTQVVTKEEWQKIKAYYLSSAPEQPIAPKPLKITRGLKHFRTKACNYRMSPPSVTMVNIDTVNHAIFAGDANSQTLSVFSAANMEFLLGAKLGESPVWMQEFSNTYLITMMGSFSPTDVGSGHILSLPKSTGAKPSKIIDSLRRPVHSSYADLDGDGQMDIVTCEFAKWTGMLAWWHNNGDGSFEKRVLRNKPGALKAYIKDMNNDGKEDIIALFGQGDEGFFIYYNEGNGKFREETALQLPPSYGSTFFQLYDFNNDGFDDIIYTAGDNADFPPILKHYHGIYIFINDGKNHFTQKHFFQLNGAYAAMPADYDMDGDIDIAAISFFPDYQNHPEESFVFLENDGQFNFTATTLNDPTMGRWIVMDAADMDGDGDKDIVLGSLAFEVVPPSNLVDRWIKDGVPFIILENTTK